jgi:hypothetical protein
LRPTWCLELADTLLRNHQGLKDDQLG